MTERILSFAESRSLQVRAEFLAGRQNTIADRLSRQDIPGDRSCLALNNRIFLKIHQIFPVITIDWFADRTNNKLPRFVSWAADERATFVDAFKNLHRNEFGYANRILYCPELPLVYRGYCLFRCPLTPDCCGLGTGGV